MYWNTSVLRNDIQSFWAVTKWFFVRGGIIRTEKKNIKAAEQIGVNVKDASYLKVHLVAALDLHHQQMYGALLSWKCS